MHFRRAVLLVGFNALIATGGVNAATFDVISAADTNVPGTLRWAITQANLASTPDRITFSIGTGPVTLAVASPLPALQHPVTIDGTTQEGYAGLPLVRIDGLAIPALNADGLVLSGLCHVRALVVTNFGRAGIQVPEGSDDNTVLGSYLGVLHDGVTAQARGRFGVVVGGDGNVIGGTGAGAVTSHRNVIGGNSESGIRLGQASTNNNIRANFIGIAADGLTAVPNGRGIDDVGRGNVTGGSTQNLRNVISGNTAAGVALGGEGNRVVGNYIGLSADGSIAVPNLEDGLAVVGPGHRIGSVISGEGNVISGNGAYGIYLRFSDDVSIVANRIGTNPAGDAAIPNGDGGISALNITSLGIGGLSAFAGNVISGNAGNGLELHYTVEGGGTVAVANNMIGLDKDGNSAIPNSGAGIDTYSLTGDISIGAPGFGNTVSGNGAQGIDLQLSDGVSVVANRIGTNAAGDAAIPNAGGGISAGEITTLTIGGATAAYGNLVAGNAGTGIELHDATEGGSTLAVMHNIVGLDKDGNTAIPNDGAGISVSDLSGNILIGAPDQGNAISGNTGDGISIQGSSGVRVRGNLVGLSIDGTSAVGNDGTGIEVGYGNSQIDIGASGEGNVVSGNQGNGVNLIEGTISVRGNLIGTSADGLSARGNADDGIAWFGADATIDNNLIAGNASTGVLIASDVARGRLINNRIGTNLAGMLAVPNAGGGIRVVQVQPGLGLRIGEPGAGNQISGHDAGIAIAIDDTSNPVLVQGNNIGLNASRDTPLPNSGALRISGAGHVIGGSEPGAGNIIAGNGDAMGLFQASGVRIEGNFIGMDGQSPALLGNGSGILVDDSSDLTIGGFAPGTGNVIAGSTFYGVRLEGGERNAILGNRIYGNIEYPIDIVPGTGPNPNDMLDLDAGPNGRQNYPEIASAVIDSADLQIGGKLHSKPATEYRVEYFHTPVCHVSGFGEARTFLGSQDVSTDNGGNVALTAVIAGGPANGFVTASATDALGNTSELGNCIAIGTPSAGEFSFIAFDNFAYEDLGVAEITVTRAGGVAGAVEVQFTALADVGDSAQAGMDFEPVTTTLSFADGESTKLVSVPILADSAVEDMEEFTIRLANPTGGASLGTPADARVVIYDHDPDDIRYSIDDTITPEPAQGQGSAVFTVTLGANTEVRTIDFATADGTAVAGLDYIATTGTLTFQPGETAKTVTVPVLADADPEDGEYFELRLSETDPQLNGLRSTGIGSIVEAPAATIFADGFDD